MVRVGRDLCGSPGPTSCRSRVTQSRLHRTASRRVLNISRHGDSTASLGSLFLSHPHSKEGFPRVQTELPVLQFVPVAPCPVTGHHWKESGPVLLTPTLQIFTGISKVPSQPSLLQAEQAQLPQPFLVGEMLQSPHHPRSPPLDSLQ